MSGALALYRLLSGAATPLVRSHLGRRARIGREDAARLGERFGQASAPRPAGPLVWLNAASVGEANSILPLASELVAAHPGSHALLTTGTVTSANLMARQLPSDMLHQYVPVDLPAAVDRFLDYWRPDLVLWTESEFWPNLILAIASRHIPLALVQGRISERTFRRWRRFPAPIHEMLAAFALCLGQTKEDAARLEALGASSVATVGNLKFAAAPLAADAQALQELRQAFDARPRWVAASTHAGEEAIVADVHRRLARRAGDLLTVIVPRHPARGDEIAALLAERSLNVARRSRHEPIGADTAIYLADTMGELGLWYRLADVVFVGGSLGGLGGGHNPLEPARLGAAILHGRGMSSFAEIAAGLAAAGASRRVGDAAELADTVGRLLLDDAAACRRMGAAALAYAESQAGALERVLEALAPLTKVLDRRSAA